MKLAMIFNRILPDMRSVIARFPLPAAMLPLLAGLLIADNHKLLHGDGEILSRLIAGFALFGLAGLVLKLAAEGHGWPARRYGLSAFAAALPIALLIGLAPAYHIHALFLALALLVLVTVAPYAARDGRHGNAWSLYVGELGMAGIMAGAATLILCAGLAGALASIGYLFDLQIGLRWFSDIFILGLVLFAPIYGLSQIPRDFAAPAAGSYPRGIAFIVRYILTPLVLVYLVILYAYLGKILLQWELPKGNLAFMVAGFGAVGLATHLLSYPLRADNRLIAWLHRWLHPALLLPVAMLWVAIGVRIGEYGVTEERYFVALIAVWLTVSAIVMTLRPATRPGLIPLLLGMLLLAASFGPWGAVGLSAGSQVARLERLLIAEGILEGGRIQPAAGGVDFETRQEISSIVTYLVNTQKAGHIQPWFGPEDHLNRSHARRPSPRKIVSDMGLSYADPWSSEEIRYFHYDATSRQGSIESHRLSDADYWLHLPHLDPGQTPLRTTLPGGGEVTAEYFGAGNELHIVLQSASGAARRLIFPLGDTLDRLYRLDRPRMDEPRPVIVAQGEGLHGRLLLTRLAGEVRDGGISLQSLGFDLLLTEE